MLAAAGSLAASAGTILGKILGNDFITHQPAPVVTLSTLVYALLWTRFMYFPGKFKWLGYVLSVPLAALNAGTACALSMSRSTESVATEFLLMMAGGAVLGMIFWVPALILSFLFFGVPVIHARKLAERGLAGEERGLTVAAAVATALAVAASVYAVMWDGEIGGGAIPFFVAILAAATGYVGIGGAFQRSRARKAFVAQVRAGEIAGYRVQPTDAGEVLLRAVMQGEGYRVAQFDEPVAELDDAGTLERIFARDR
jgi:hypothetical protein